MTQILAQIDHLSKFFVKGEKPALDDVSSSFSEGKIVGLVGPDGAGKTTLIRIMAGLLIPTDGKVTVLGFDVVSQAELIHQNIGYMPQKFGLYEELSVLQNLELYANLQGIPPNDQPPIFERLLAFTNLAPFTDRLARNLSGGMKQKLGLACALVKKPNLLLLDEPSVGVDPISRRELWAMVAALSKEGITVLWSTAYLDEAEKCAEVMVLNEGKLIYDKDPTALTVRAEGRTFHLLDPSMNKRTLLSKALNDPQVIDGVIQGKFVRVILKKGETLDLKRLGCSEKAIVSPTPPRFEDAYMDILGGGPGGRSLLAEKLPFMDVKHETIIEARNLTKKFGDFTAVNHISFSVKGGEIFGLLGPNGAGKSTTFRMMCGLLKPTEGEVFVSGIPLLKAPGKARAKIGYMAQKFSLYNQLTVKQNLDFFSGVYNLVGEKRKNIIEEMIETFELENFQNTITGELPLGFKQRLALACAVMHQPHVLFLDEPTSGVDPMTRREFWNHINGIVEKGTTVVLSTHFIEEAEYCDTIGLIYKGDIIARGTPDEIKESVRSKELENPTLEDAFITLIQTHDASKGIKT